jgi:hypothetical protein
MRQDHICLLQDNRNVPIRYAQLLKTIRKDKQVPLGGIRALKALLGRVLARGEYCYRDLPEPPGHRFQPSPGCCRGETLRNSLTRTAYSLRLNSQQTTRLLRRINVPAEFFDNVVKPTFTGRSGIVYVLPEIQSMSEIFASYNDVELDRRAEMHN